MRYLFILLLIIVACQANEQREKLSDDWLKDYSQQSLRTDPGDHASLYNSLPASLDSLCDLIKCQLIHPLEARQMNLPMEESMQDGALLTVSDMLAELWSRDSTGLNYHREIPDRLVVACNHHAMLLASILRYNDIPVRMRAGYSRYYEKEYGIRFGHIICQVWDDNAGKWILVDPDRKIVDLPENKFDFGCEAWINVNENKFDPGKYLSSVSEGVRGIINIMILDAAFIIKDEKLHWDLPEIAVREINDLKDLDDDIILILNELADHCNNPDIKINELTNICQTTDYFKSAGMEYESYVEMIMNRE